MRREVTPIKPNKVGHERWAANAFVPRHRHRYGYAALVLAGGYEERGSGGRFRVGPGDVLIHGSFDAHLDRMHAKGAVILDLELSYVGPSRAGRVCDPDSIARLAETDPAAAAAQLDEQFVEIGPTIAADWPDLLARDLIAQPHARLDAWARDLGIAPETLSRGFGKRYGVTPAKFRVEVRTMNALRRIVTWDEAFVDIAATTGFADQAHMTRAVCALTGAPPSYWRDQACSRR
jgi:AraC-like DNA-binding protein